MALNLTTYKSSLVTAATAAKTADDAKLAGDPAFKTTRIAELQAKWDGLKAQEAEIGRALAADPATKQHDALLTEIDKLKTDVSAKLAALGVTVS